jgi:type IV secretory pathway VirB10-like protein
MSLFRRRRDKEDDGPEPASAESAGGTPAESPGQPPLPAVTAKAPAPEAPLPPPPASGPPPLPDRAPTPPVAEAAERSRYGICFVCGTPLEGRSCPTCKMSWVE